ncbi:hypothetical protein RXV95_04840 [Novosphingobium sp. ZN18A2]|uniref:hypothetical protein n=1 Tax=Novosphingobium sp. ZN18A2 TaxID=3079861 RepID=UPI0030D2439F
MTDHPIRLFADDEAVRRVGTGLLDRSLPKEEWTHEAHLAACLWLVRERPDFACETQLPNAIRAFNAAKGGINDDTQGYHETLTQLYIAGVRRFAVSLPEGVTLVEAVNRLLASDMAPRDWPLRFYTRERLFSVEARRRWIAPDLGPLA